MKHEPSYLEIFLTKLAFFFMEDYLPGIAALLPLTAGSGCWILMRLGTVAYYTAKTDSWTIDLPGYFRKMVKCLSQDIASLWHCRLSAAGNPGLQRCFDLIYCHFVLHDIAEGELERVIRY